MILVAKVALSLRGNGRRSRRLHASRRHRAGSSGRQPRHPRPHLGAGSNRPNGDARGPDCNAFRPEARAPQIPSRGPASNPDPARAGARSSKIIPTREFVEVRDSDTHVVVRTVGKKVVVDVVDPENKVHVVCPLAMIQDVAESLNDMKIAADDSILIQTQIRDSGRPPSHPASQHSKMKNAGHGSGVFLFMLNRRMPTDSCALPNAFGSNGVTGPVM